MAIMAVGNTRIMPGSRNVGLLVRSEQANHREQQTLQNLLKDSTRELKAFPNYCARTLCL